jgi:HEAT repeat protein
MALDKFKDPRIVEPLIPLLQDKEGFIRGIAAEILGKSNDTHAVNALLAAFKEHNTDVISGAYDLFIQRGEPGSEDELIQTLNRHSDGVLAQHMLNSRNAKLEDAARIWAKNHGDQMEPHDSGPLWGSARQTLPPGAKN